MREQDFQAKTWRDRNIAGPREFYFHYHTVFWFGAVQAMSNQPLRIEHSNPSGAPGGVRVMQISGKPWLQNSLLSALSERTLQRIEAKLDRVRLLPETQIVAPGEQPEFVYFPESGCISVLTCGDRGRMEHVGFYGYEGAGSVAVILGGFRCSFLEIVQFGGDSWRIAARDLEDAMSSSPELRSLLFSYVYVLMTQIADTALANGSLRIDQRLARWLLMIQDRLRTSSIVVTHQKLADLMGVRRSGVTDAIHILEENHLIRARRGLIDILHKDNLQTLAAGCYSRPEAAFERLVAPRLIHDHEEPERDSA